MPKITLSNGISLFYVLEGEPTKPLLLLSHGFGSDIHSFDHIVPFLLPDFQVLRWDHRGHGDSDQPKGADHENTLPLYQMNVLANDIFELLVALKLMDRKPVYLYGHSMGGMVAQSFVLQFPNALTRLGLASTCPNNNTDAMIKMVNDYKAGKHQFNEESFKMNVLIGYTHKYLREHPEVVEESVRRKMKVGPQILLALMENFVMKFNVEDQLSSIQIPTIILHGKRDGTINYQNAEKIHLKITNSLLITFPKMGHGINSEIPEEVVQHLHNFFLAN
jgi:3-oxoadipate enol-lactonase